MPLLPECLPYPFKNLFLPAILLRVTEKHAAFGQRIDLLFQERSQWQHTGRNDRDIIQPGFQNRLWWVCESIPVSPVVCVSHHILVSCIIFLEFCFPKWI